MIGIWDIRVKMSVYIDKTYIYRYVPDVKYFLVMNIYSNIVKETVYNSCVNISRYELMNGVLKNRYFFYVPRN